MTTPRIILVVPHHGTDGHHAYSPGWRLQRALRGLTVDDAVLLPSRTTPLRVRRKLVDLRGKPAVTYFLEEESGA